MAECDHIAAEEPLLREVQLRVLISVTSTHGRRLAFGGNALLSLIMGRLRRQCWKVFAELGRHLSMSPPVCIERQGYLDISVRHTVLVVKLHELFMRIVGHSGQPSYNQSAWCFGCTVRY